MLDGKSQPTVPSVHGVLEHLVAERGAAEQYAPAVGGVLAPGYQAASSSGANVWAMDCGRT
jgi:hypothetical protein